MVRHIEILHEIIDRHYGIALTSVKEHFAYRFDFFTSLIFSLMVMGLLYYLWTAIYQSATDLALPFQGVITYVCLGQAFNFTRHAQRRAIQRVSQAIRTGDIGIDLIRPSDFQARLLSESLGMFAVETLLISLPAYLFALLFFKIDAPVSPVAALGFGMSLLGAFLLAFALNFLVTVLAFWTLSTFGLIYAKKAIVDILAGAIIPLSFFPDWLQRIALALPFQGIAYIPLSIYIGTIQGVAIWTSVLSQLAWAAVLILLTRVLWLWALRRVIIHGG